MRKYTSAVGVITLLILLPMVLLSAYGHAAGRTEFAQYAAEWKEPLMLLIGFWIRGATEKE